MGKKEKKVEVKELSHIDKKISKYHKYYCGFRFLARPNERLIPKCLMPASVYYIYTL